jgi:hypothetical protein
MKDFRAKFETQVNITQSFKNLYNSEAKKHRELRDLIENASLFARIKFLFTKRL